jgi:hypothetical protein
VVNLFVGPIIYAVGRCRYKFASQPDAPQYEAFQHSLVIIGSFEITITIYQSDDASHGPGDALVSNQCVPVSRGFSGIVLLIAGL